MPVLALVSQGALSGVLLPTFLILSIASFVLFGLVELVWPGHLPESVKEQVSIIINKYLDWKYPILHKDGRTKLPSCPYVWPNGQGDIAKFLDGLENSSSWEKQNGAVYRIWSGMKPEVVLTQPRMLQPVFKDSDKHSKAPANNSGWYMGQLLGQCVGLISGQNWRALRAVTEVPFGHRAISLRVGDFQQHVASHFADLHRKGTMGQGRIHPAGDMKMLPFWVVAEIFYGRSLSAELKDELRHLAPVRERIFHEHVIQGGLPRFSMSQYLPTRANAELRAYKQAWKEFNQRAVAFACVSEPDAPIIQMQEAVASGDITEEQLLQTLDESLYANLDVTTGGLSWNLVFLAAHPEAQSRVRAEVLAASREGRLEGYLLDRTTYLSACVLESARLRPLAAFSVPQAAPTDREIDGYVIPAGTSFIVDAYALNIRNEAWAPDNEAFRPERFLASLGGRDHGDRDGDRGGIKTASELRYLFWRFGFGPRQCMGKHAADLIIRATLAYLVQNYELGLLSDDAWVRSRECWISHPDFQLRCVRRPDEVGS
ncbi:cytochrome P450 [Podospora australis]|uniref:Cytochrome P450 n=1 Tax=Podospora australis TaxID=1536484 RepID=A0AAN7AER3_9PEZI|nr:cytochrome P450 [Podospora australis]